MAVYVDALMDHGWRLGPNCHMTADTLEELHAMAEAIGMKRAWFQNKGTLPHYDLVKSRREKAVRLGAIEMDRFAAVDKHWELREKFNGIKRPVRTPIQAGQEQA